MRKSSITWMLYHKPSSSKHKPIEENKEKGYELLDEIGKYIISLKNGIISL